jgi:hypothetical protein
MDDVSRRAVSRLAGRLRSRLSRRAALTTAPALLVLPLLADVSGSAVTPQAAAPGPQDVPAVNWALSGHASATSTESGDPASNAIDGDAATDWCTGSWTGSLVIDLGQVRALSDLGITLDATSPSASATIKVAAQAGNWQAVPAARNVALDPGNPMYVPLPRGTQARYAQLTVFSGTGADVCVGEFRTYEPDPAAAGMFLGGDLSFTPQELAAGAQFTYRGQQQSPVTRPQIRSAGPGDARTPAVAGALGMAGPRGRLRARTAGSASGLAGCLVRGAEPEQVDQLAEQRHGGEQAHGQRGTILPGVHE